MSIVKKIARKSIIPLVYNLGIHKNKILKYPHHNFILCYHGVSFNPNFQINNRHIPINEFEKNLIFFKKHFQIVPLKEIFDDYRNNISSKKPKVALTFDDGYLNNVTTALPLLEKYNAPATYFIITSGIEDEQFMSWPDIIDIAIYSNKTDSLIFNEQEFIKQNNLYVDKRNGLDISSSIKKMGNERESALIDFKNRYIKKSAIDANKEYWKLMNKAELLKCSQNPLIEIGSHTHLHYNLGNISSELANQELIKSKSILENIIQKNVESIAYPDGHYNENIKELSKNAGYKNLCAVSYILSDDKNDISILNRFSISNSTTHQSNIIRLASQINKVGI